MKIHSPLRSAFGIFAALIAFCTLHSSFFIGRIAAQATERDALVTVTGRVSDAVANTYLNNAEVRVAGTNILVYTRDDGTYSVRVPAGTVTITVSYASSRPATRSIEAKPDVANTLDFVLQPMLAVPSSAVRSGAGAVDPSIVQLERFVVTDERVGQAKVIMEQRAADNAKTIISTDQFGELTQGSVGEFMKYMPGVTLDLDDEGETAYARVGGLDPKYVGFSVDGISLPAANESSSRANNFNQMSIASIESIEFNQTLLARMPANTAAGKFDLRTRYSFNRKKPEITFDLGFDGTGETIELGSAYMPDNKKHMRTYLGGRIMYGGAFFKRRLGIEATVARYQNYRNDQRHEITYTYLVPPSVNFETGEFVNPNPGTTFVERNGRLEAAEGPVIRQLSWMDGPRIITRTSASLSLDYKITSDFTFSLRSQYVINEKEYFNIYYNLLGENRDDDFVANQYSPTPGLDPSSSLTRWVVNPTGPGGTQALESILIESPSSRVEDVTTYSVSPRLNFKKGGFEAELKTAYANSRAEYGDGNKGRFRTVPNRLGGIGWIAERPSTDSPTWTLTQTAGSLWTEPQNLSRATTYLMGVYYDDPHYIENSQTSANLDLTYAANVFNHPVTFRAGAAYLESDWTRRRNRKDFNYIGPEGDQMSSLFPFAENYVFNMDLGGKAGNIAQQGWPVVDQDKLWANFKAHPEWFLPEWITNAQNALVNRNDIVETIDALYAEATTRAGRFSFNLGLRGERTTTDVPVTRMRSNEEMAFYQQYATPEETASGKYNTGTIQGKLFQYYNGERINRKDSYSNLFLSGGLKYDITKNLRFQFSMSQAILRPDAMYLAGTVNYPDNYYVTNLWIPNPNLKPERTTKYYVGLQYYLKPSGILEISAYRLDIKDMQTPNMQITSDQAQAMLGYSLADAVRDFVTENAADGEELPEEALEQVEVWRNRDPIVYRATINATGGARSVYGVTVHYDQNLTFLPGYLKGLSVFGSFTNVSLKNAQMEEEKIGRSGNSANGGIRYRYGRFNINLNGSWQDDALKSITRPYIGRRWVTSDYRYQKARLTIGLSSGWRLNKNLDLIFSVSNLTAEPIIWYSNVPDRLTRYSAPDVIWNLSVRGKY